MNSLKELRDSLTEAKEIDVFCHVNPDGDCLGSMLALGIALKKLGKPVRLWSKDPVPDMYSFLPGVDGIKLLNEYQSTPGACLVFVDTSDLRRVSESMGATFAGLRETQSINIDHHISNDQFAHLNYVDANAAATGEIIFELLTNWIELDREIATNIYVAIVTDTGSFRYEATSPRTHEIAAQLLANGVHVESVTNRLYNQMTQEAITALKVGLDKLRVSENGKVAWITLSQHLMNQHQLDEEHLEGLVTYAKSVKGAEIGLLFKEQADYIKISFRSTGLADVNRIAQQFNGGGHKKAAGAKLKGDLGQIVEQVLQACRTELQRVHENDWHY